VSLLQGLKDLEIFCILEGRWKPWPAEWFVRRGPSVSKGLNRHVKIPITEPYKCLSYSCDRYEGNSMLLTCCSMRLVMIDIIGFCMRNSEPAPKLLISLPGKVSVGGVFTLAIKRGRLLS